MNHRYAPGARLRGPLGTFVVVNWIIDGFGAPAYNCRVVAEIAVGQPQLGRELTLWEHELAPLEGASA